MSGEWAVLGEKKEFPSPTDYRDYRGVWIDANLSMRDHTCHLVLQGHAFFHLRRLRIVYVVNSVEM